MRIYFSGIGGVGVGPLAEIARDAGHDVLGSDQSSTLITRELEGRGIPVSIGQDGTFLRNNHANKPIDLLVYTAALPVDHPELLAAYELGITAVKRDELLARIIKEKDLKLIAITGTHGKTTTTGMAVWTLQKLGIPVSYSIGSTLSFGPSGLFNPESQYFVYECDEFDRNFLHFSPHLSLITSVDYDHPDTYPTKEEYLDAFRQFIDQSDGVIMWNRDNKQLNSDSEHMWSLQENEVAKLDLAGEHNRRNATLVLKMLERLNIGDTPINNQKALEQFPGTDRRFELLAENIRSDYGHHPAEIAATLQMARELSDNVVLVYQPHQNRRQHALKDTYSNQFELASKIYWLPTYLTREDPSQDVLSPETLVQNLTNKDKVEFAALDDALWDSLTKARDEGKLVLVMGAGDIDSWARQNVAQEQV